MNLANLLTIGRFLMIPVYLLVFFSTMEYNKLLAFGVLLVAGFTDLADGYIARKYNMVTRLGILLDPLADKLLMITVFATFLISGLISWWAAAAFFIRDVSMIIIGAACHLHIKKTIPANQLGKLTTFLFYVAFFFVLFEMEYSETFLWMVICLSFLTSLFYFLSLTKVTT